MSTTLQEPKPADPKQQGAQPPFQEKQQQPPGHEGQMSEKPDHGEQSYKGLGRLKGRTALITGADSGIGKAVAIAFAREGADVLISYLNEEDDAQESARWVSEAGRKAITVAGDIGEVSHCEKLVERAFNEFGKLDILVNNAAFQMTHDSIQEFSPEEWDHTFRTNIYAMFYLCRAALPRMREGGSIINTASVQAYEPASQLLAYASTKGAIVTFTKALSQFGLKQGVRVNAVAPGPVWTPLIVSTMPKEKVEKFGESNPQGRPAQPVELAPAYVFLASDEARFVNGAVMDMTGGKMLP
jgi:NAD(P)-dependent dehydrogenase (short-subunit alcohol dehydrogenase family)